jgi:hypothetical protein
MDIICYSDNLSRLDKANCEPCFIHISDILSSNRMLINLLLISDIALITRDSLVFAGKELLDLNKPGYCSLKALMFLYKVPNPDAVQVKQEA